MAEIIQEVALKDVRFFAPIGFYEEERILNNEFFVDLMIFFPFRNEAPDELPNTVNYAELFQLLQQTMKKERKLLESAAHEILERTLAQYDFITELKVSIRKTTPPFGIDNIHAVVSLHYNK
ncbi:dihydroneopterin aldolase [Sphingobacterium sp. LRF_L2]|uniref:dihydroneopterin aldolase n=1 Tax=Sphingobacterium sp. LRF_L2 TaxID=3369421 RepID=UPI003F633BFA